MENKEIVIGIIITIIIIGSVLILYKPEDNNLIKEGGYLYISNNSMICNYSYMCYNIDGIWRKPAYNAGVNLILANKINISDNEELKNFFKNKKILIVVNPTEDGSPENSNLILATTPMAYYMGYYFNRVKGEEKEIYTISIKEYDWSEPAIIIYGPEISGSKNTIEYTGNNIIIKATSYVNLRLLLGKLIIIFSNV